MKLGDNVNTVDDVDLGLLYQSSFIYNLLPFFR